MDVIRGSYRIFHWEGDTSQNFDVVYIGIA